MGLVKRCFAVGAAFLILTALSAAQAHGVPASVTSLRTGDSVFSQRGIPSSVSSPGSEGFGSPSLNFAAATPSRRDRLGRVMLQAPIPLFYEVPYYQVVNVRTPEGRSYVERRVDRDEPQKIIVEIRDTRPVASASNESVPEKKPAPRDDVETPRATAVFIFHDGSRKELKDFAITQTELIDLSEGAIRRTPLTKLDRAATLKANAEHGIELHFPSASSD